MSSNGSFLFQHGEGPRSGDAQYIDAKLSNTTNRALDHSRDRRHVADWLYSLGAAMDLGLGAD